MKTLTTNKGTEVLVDDDVFEWASKMKWHEQTGRGYVRSSTKHGKCVYLHREITKANKGEHVDHKNNNIYDNRRENLRVCTQAENNRNTRPREGKYSKYKGVYRGAKRGKPYKSQICVDRETIHIGSFETEIEAAIAYNNAAKEYFGEYAYLNRIEL